MRRVRHGLLLSCLLLAISACGSSTVDETGTPPVDPTEAVFDPARFLAIDITIDPADWDELRIQTRSLDILVGDNCLDEPRVRPFTYFPADIAIDGQVVATVGVRKKGFLGSMSTERPSLKVKFNEYVAGQQFSGLTRLTLNNCRQDPAYVRQCVGYRLFERAGVPAPRCNLARVSVNGADLGIYANVESIKRTFLARHFDDDRGNLYEGALSDFRPDWLGSFERKNNKDDPDRSELEAVMAALEADDAALLGALDPLLDVDGLINFWAAEVLIAHWDGYAGNTNNFYLYRDPSDGRFQFIPWGADAILYDRPEAEHKPASVYAEGALTHRLYHLPEAQGRYLARLGELLDTAWSPDSMLADIDQMQAQIMPAFDETSRELVVEQIDVVRSFVQNRREHLLAELDFGPPEWPWPLRDPPCFVPIGALSGSFSTTWGTLSMPNPFTTGSGTFDGTFEGEPLPVEMVGSKAGLDPDPPPEEPVLPWVQIVALQPGDMLVGASIQVKDPTKLGPGKTISINTVDAFGVMFFYNINTDENWVAGILFGGELSFEQAGTQLGQPVVGSFESTVVESAW